MHKLNIFDILEWTQNVESRKKKRQKGDGILICVKNHIKFKIIKDLSVSGGDSECVTVEIENKN